MSDNASPTDAPVEEISLTESARIVEADRDKREAVIDIVEVGMGNRRDRRMYEAEYLKSAADVFVGAKMFSDHLSREQEKRLAGSPRSIRDLTGRIREAWWNPEGGADGNGSIQARVSISAPWLWELIEHDPELVACSMNALGRTRPVQGPDGQTAHLVEAITHCHSVDWVAQAGAGGRVLDLLEDAATPEDTMDFEKITMDDLRAERPDLVSQIEDALITDIASRVDDWDIEADAATDEPVAASEDESKDEPEAEGDEAPDTEDEAPAEAEAEDEDEAEAKVEDAEPVLVGAGADLEEADILTTDEVMVMLREAEQAAEQRVMEKMERKFAYQNRLRENRMTVVDMLSTSGLPSRSQAVLREEFHDFDGDEAALAAALKESIKDKKAELAEARGRGVTGLGASVARAADAAQPKGTHSTLMQDMGIDDGEVI